MQPVTTTHVLRRRPTPTPPAASSPPPPPPPPPSPINRAAPPHRPPELPLPSALVPPKKRRVLRAPPKATTPLPPPPPAVTVPAPTPPPPSQADHAESPLFPAAQKPSPPPPPAEKPSSPPPSPPPAGKPSSPPPPPPPAENSSSPPPPPPPPPAENPFSPPPPPPAENPSFPPPPPAPAADEKPLLPAPPPTDAAAEPAPAPKPRKITRKVRTIIRRVPKGTIAARKAAAEAASAAAAGELQPGMGHAPDTNSSRNADAADEVVQKEQSFGGNTIEKPATGCNRIVVCETLLGKGTAVCETQLGKGTVGGGTLPSEPGTDFGGEHEQEKKLGSRGEDRAEVGMSERQRRRKTEVFVGGLSRDAKEEDVRAALSVAGEITEVRMIMDVMTKKNRGYCFVGYRESAQARKAIAQFRNVKICGKQCRVAALDGNDKIFLGNIDKKWKKEDIVKLLQKIGVENIDVVTLLDDPNNPGYNRGFAFLELETYRDAQIAYRKLSRKNVFGKGLNIRVDWAEPLNGPDEKQMQKVNIGVSLAKSVQKGKKNMEDHKFCISEKDKTKTAKSERILEPSSLHILPSSSSAVPVAGDKSSPTYGLVQVLRELAPWRHERTVSGSLTQNYPHILSGEKRPFSALGIDSYCMSRNPPGGHERNTYATSTSSYSVSPPAATQYSPPYHPESSRYLLDSDSVLSEPWGGMIQMRQACSRKSGMSHDSWHQ